MADGSFLGVQCNDRKGKLKLYYNYYIYNIYIIYIVKFCFQHRIVLVRKLPSAICTTFWSSKITACFFACFFWRIIWKVPENLVPLHCQRKKTKFATCLSNKNCLRARHLFPRQSQKWRFFRDKSYYLTIWQFTILQLINLLTIKKKGIIYGIESKSSWT